MGSFVSTTVGKRGRLLTGGGMVGWKVGSKRKVWCAGRLFSAGGLARCRSLFSIASGDLMKFPSN